jgi:hypothetical protein
MTATFATGRIAIALCDRCGMQYKLRVLQDQIVDQKKTGLLVCPDCYDEDQPQLRLGKTPIYDPQALRNPRPDKRTDVTNSPVLTGEYTSYGQPIFTTNVTPYTGTLESTGAAPTARRG